MEYVKLGNSDLKVSRVCLGCISFGNASGMQNWALNYEDSEKIIKHALDLGIDFFDTANCYSNGSSEEYLGRALRKFKNRDEVIMSAISKHFDILTDYLEMNEIGRVLAKGAGTPSMIRKEYLVQAYNLGKNLK